MAWIMRFDGKDAWPEEIKMPSEKKKEGHEGAVERESVLGLHDDAPPPLTIYRATEEEQKAARYAELKRHHQIEACLRGEHEATTRDDGFVTHVCVHCRCVFVPR